MLQPRQFFGTFIHGKIVVTINQEQASSRRQSVIHHARQRAGSDRADTALHSLDQRFRRVQGFDCPWFSLCASLNAISFWSQVNIAKVNEDRHQTVEVNGSSGGIFSFLGLGLLQMFNGALLSLNSLLE